MADPARLDSLPRPGQTVGGRYSVTTPLGEGGMGVVYEAIDTMTARRVAIKFLRPSVLTVKEAVTRFEREARLAAQLQNRNVAQVLDVHVGPGVPYIVMELLEGRDLSEELEEKQYLSIPEAVDFTLQACAAMGDAHAHGIIHRDLKPSNLYLCEENGRIVVKVLDFGVSKAMDDRESKVTMTQSSFGTPLYMSPEQVRSVKTVDARTDVWSLGVILYEMLTGRPPFLGTATAAAAAIVADPITPPGQLRADIPQPLETVVMAALAKDPNARFPDMHAFARALMPFAPKAPIASGTRLRTPTTARLRRQRMMEGANCAPDDPTVLRGDRRAGTEGSWSSAHSGMSSVAASKRMRRWIAVSVVAAVSGLAIIGVVVANRMRASAYGTSASPPTEQGDIPPAVATIPAVQPSAIASAAPATAASGTAAATVDVEALPHVGDPKKPSSAKSSSPSPPAAPQPRRPTAPTAPTSTAAPLHL